MKRFRHYEIWFQPGTDWHQVVEQCGENGWRVVELFQVPHQLPTGGFVFNVMGAFLEQEYEAPLTQIPDAISAAFGPLQTEVPPPPDGH